MDPLEDILDTVQRDTFERLTATPGLEGVRIIMEQEKDLSSQVETILAKLSGLCIIVLRAEVADVEKNLPGPTFGIRQEVQVIEHPLINQAKGSGLRCASAAIRVLRSLHLATIGNSTLHGAKDAIKNWPVRDGFISNLVSVNAKPASAYVDKPAGVDAQMIDGNLVFSCATPDTQIYFSTDGSYPRPGSGNGQLYTAPIELPPPDVRFRVSSYAPGMNPGDVLNFITEP